MSRPAPALRALYDQEMAAARAACAPELRWAPLKPAHVVSQPDAWLHTRIHVATFAWAVHGRDRRAAVGQVVRIVVAAPGSLTGRFPDGDTGRVAAGLLTPMAPPADLAAALGR